jgi:hypothetical protein
MSYAVYTPEEIVDFDFNTIDSTIGAPITLAGSPVVKVYKGSSTTTEVTTGVTLTVDFDQTGHHHVSIVLTDSFYAAEQQFCAVLTAGTVDGISVAGRVLYNFAIRQIPGVVLSGFLQSGSTSTSIKLPATASAVDNFYRGCVAELVRTVAGAGTGVGQARTIIAGYNGSTKVALLDPNDPWIVTPDTTTWVRVWAAPLGSTDVALATAVRTNLESAPLATDLNGDILGGITGVMVEAYSVDGAAVTLPQALYELLARDQEVVIAGTTMTVKKRDGSTTAYVLTLDSSTVPTTVTRTA